MFLAGHERVTDLQQLQALASICSRNFTSVEDDDAPCFSDVTAPLLPLARRHRVQGLCWRGLRPDRSKLPEDVAAQLESDARKIAEAGLRAAVASRSIFSRLQHSGLPVLFLKGQAVGKLAYGDPFVKMSSDIDILVEPASIAAAAFALEELGYQSLIPSNLESIVRWHQSSKESVWGGPGLPTVELHSRIADNPRLLNRLDVHSPSQLVDIGFDTLLPTFDKDELFAYLAVHGASSAWFRLKWLCDFAALLASSDEEEIDRLHDRSLTLGAGRASGWALLLSQQFFDVRLSTGLSDTLRQDRALAVLQKLALRQLLDLREPTERPLGTLGIHASQLLLKPGLGFAFGEGLRQIRQFARGS